MERGSTTSFELTSPDAAFEVEVVNSDGQTSVSMGGERFNVLLKKEGPKDYLAIIGGRRVRFSTEEMTPTSVKIRIGDDLLEFRRSRQTTELRDSHQPKTSSRMEGSLASPMPGRVVSVSVKEGQNLSVGDPIVVIESMKMESVLRADKKTRVEKVLVSEGESVKRGQALVKYAVTGEPS